MSSRDSPRVDGSSPDRGSFFLLNLYVLIQFCHRCKNDLFLMKPRLVDLDSK